MFESNLCWTRTFRPSLFIHNYCVSVNVMLLVQFIFGLYCLFFLGITLWLIYINMITVLQFNLLQIYKIQWSCGRHQRFPPSHREKHIGHKLVRLEFYLHFSICLQIVIAISVFILILCTLILADCDFQSLLQLIFLLLEK